MSQRPPRIVVVAGLDPSGGAGLVADVRVATWHGVWAGGVATAATIQDTCGVQGWRPLPAAVVAASLAGVLADLEPAAVKVGMLGGVAVARAVARVLAGWRSGAVVVDPVLAASDGTPLVAHGARPALERLLRRAELLTPNHTEAALLLGWRPEVVAAERGAAARALQERYGGWVLLTGGELDARDLLLGPDGEPRWLGGRRTATPHTHGTGCALTTAIAARLARGASLPDAVAGAVAWLQERLAGGGAVVGRGRGSPWAAPDDRR